MLFGDRAHRGRGYTMRADQSARAGQFSLAPTQPLPSRAAGGRRYAQPGERTQTRRAWVGLTQRLGLLTLASLALFALLNVGDLLSTYVGLHAGMSEGNPLMNRLLGHYGFGALVAYKLFVIGAVSCGVLFLQSLHRRMAQITLVVCNALVLGVVILNVVQYALLAR